VDLTVRPAHADDAETLIDLWNICGLMRWWNDPREDFQRFLDSSNADILVGEDDGEVAASICVGHDAHRGWHYYLAVHPGCRNRGYGRQLVRAAELWLSEREIPKAQAMIQPQSQEVAGFYEALGYEPDAVGVVSHWLRDPGLPPDSRVSPDSDGNLDITITYLEMTTPPQDAPPHPPAGQRVALMRAERPPVSFYRFLYNTIGTPWLWWERRALDDGALARVIQDDRVEIYVLYVDGVPAGYAELDRRGEPEIDLAYFGIMPEYIGRGFGRYLLSSAIHMAWAYAPDKLTVNTNTLDHPRALPLYQKVGFTPVGQEIRTIIDPRLTGLIPTY
jgi:ribosomal protein S18 acetylase RimI-like enzyme